MEKAWNAEKGFFCQSYEDKVFRCAAWANNKSHPGISFTQDVLDSAVLVMPLVFFCAAGEPRYSRHVAFSLHELIFQM